MNHRVPPLLDLIKDNKIETGKEKPIDEGVSNKRTLFTDSKLNYIYTETNYCLIRSLKIVSNVFKDKLTFSPRWKYR